MRRVFVLSALILAIVVGCDTSRPGNSPDGGTSDATRSNGHEHPSEGPHHGTLVELGKEELHAEIVHTQDTVTVYILDSHAKAAVPVDASEVTINVVHAGQPEQFKLTADPESGETDGKSSRFTISDAELAGHIDDPAANAKLSLSIGGKSYRGDIKHDHDHDHAH